MLQNCQGSATDDELAQIIVVSSDSNSSISSSSVLLPELRCPGESIAWKLDVLRPKDLVAFKRICRDSFPLDYPDSWFDDVVAGKFIAFGVFHGDVLTSLLVAEITKLKDCDKEDQDLDSDPEILACYILSLAVSAEYRRRGIASILINHLLKVYVYAPPFPRLVFLHVLHSNFGAINFYKKSGFRHHATLQNYYVIDEVYQAGCTFVLRTDRSSTSRSIKEFFSFLLALVCKPFRALFRSKLF